MSLSLRGAFALARKLLRLSMRDEFRRGLRYGVAASVEHLGMMRSLKLTTLVDVGANVGQFTLLAVALNPDIVVEAFEPQAAPAAVFRKLFASNPRVALHQVAIGSKEATATMNIARRGDSSSLLGITALQSECFPGTEKVGVEDVQVATLESQILADKINAPALLKLDVQGYELEVLRGSSTMLHLFDYVYAELSFVELYEGQAPAHRVIQFLSESGFSLTGAYNGQYDATGRSIQCDCLFTRSL